MTDTSNETKEVFPCYEEGCDFEGKNEASLQMHFMRKHSNDERWRQGTKIGQQRAIESKKAKAAARRRPTIPELQELAQPTEQTRQRAAINYGTPIPCVICGKPITPARMRSHLRRVHDATVPDKPRPTIQQRRNQLPRTPTSGITVREPVTSTSREPRGFVRNPEWERPDEIDPETSAENWEITANRELAAQTVNRASAEFVRLTAERAESKLNLAALTLADDVVLLRDDSGHLWMLKRVD